MRPRGRLGRPSEPKPRARHPRPCRPRPRRHGEVGDVPDTLASWACVRRADGHKGAMTRRCASARSRRGSCPRAWWASAQIVLEFKASGWWSRAIPAPPEPNCERSCPYRAHLHHRSDIRACRCLAIPIRGGNRPAAPPPSCRTVALRAGRGLRLGKTQRVITELRAGNNEPIYYHGAMGGYADGPRTWRAPRRASPLRRRNKAEMAAIVI